MIIDTHSQLATKEAMEGIPDTLIAGYKDTFSDIDLPGIENTIKDMDEADVQKSVIVAIDAETTYKYKVSNEIVAEAVNKYPEKLIGFASVDPHKGILAAEELVTAIEKLGLRGLKIVPNLIEMYANDSRLYHLYEIARNYDIPVLFHAGTLFYTGIKMKYGQPLPIDDIAVDFPELKIIIAHFGFPWFYETIAIVQRNPNVYFNIAGWKPRYIPKEVVSYMNGQLKHKALFGSDYPLLTRKALIEELHELGLKEETMKSILTENPKRVLGIS